MVERFFRVQSSSNSEWVVNNYGRRLLVGSSVTGSVIRAGLTRHLLQVEGSMFQETSTSSSNTTPPPPPPPSSPSPAKFQALDPNVVIIMVVLLFALICAAFINSAMRYVLRRRAREQSARAMFMHREGDNSSEHGLDAKTLATLPVLTFKVGENSKRMDVDCTICLSEFNENDRLRLLPKCNHVFHLDCIDMWLLSHTSCPVCRDPIAVDGDDAACAPTLDQATESGGTIFLTRDHQGNASARFSSASRAEIVPIGKGETQDVRAELVRDTSWNSLSEGRYTGSRRLSRREGSMERIGSSRHSFRAQIAAILSSDKPQATSARWQPSSSSVPSAPPVAPSFERATSARPSSELPSTEGGLASQDQLRSSEQLIEMN